MAEEFKQVEEALSKLINVGSIMEKVNSHCDKLNDHDGRITQLEHSDIRREETNKSILEKLDILITSDKERVSKPAKNLNIVSYFIIGSIVSGLFGIAFKLIFKI